MSRTCYLCGEALPRWSNIGSIGAGSIPMNNYFCQTCALIQQSPIPKEDTFVFEHNVAAQELRAKESGISKQAEKLLKKRQLMMGETMNQLLIPGMKVADLGCGYASFLAYLRDEKQVDVVGVELNPLQAQFARETYHLPIANMTIERWIEEEARTFDVVLLSHVLEHLRDPIEVLRRLKKRLTANGRLVIEVPNVAVPTRSLHLFFKPEHFWNFTHPTFRALLARAGVRIDVFQTPVTHSKVLAICRYERADESIPSRRFVRMLFARMQWFRCKSFLRRIQEQYLSF